MILMFFSILQTAMTKELIENIHSMVISKKNNIMKMRRRRKMVRAVLFIICER